MLKLKMKKMGNEQLFNELIEKVVDEIDRDIVHKEVEALEELLRFCPIENLINYLPEEKHEQYKKLLKWK
jgi:hypothetical protein